jgi:hypothetical protein
MPREAWLDECARRLSTHGIDGPSIAPTCQSWWAFYQGGGAPDPVYGYTVPIKVTETRIVTRETIIETRHGTTATWRIARCGTTKGAAEIARAETGGIAPLVS